MRNLDISEFEDYQDESYKTWSSSEGFDKAMAQMSSNVSEYGEISRASFSSRDRSFLNIDDVSNLSVRSEYNRVDYDYFRPSERVWTDPQKIMQLSNRAYKKVPVVRSVIDMMSDFTNQSIRIVHPNKNIENFYRRWAEVVHFEEVSERITNTLYRLANCPIKIRYGRVNASIEKKWRKSKALTEDTVIQKRNIERRKIPLDYKILNPVHMEIIGGDVASFVGKPIYAMKISSTLRNKIRRLITAKSDVNINGDIKELLSHIPEQLRNAIIKGQRVIPLDQSKIEMLHYKKDDWEVWAIPLLASILESIGMLEKMHLSDLSALDGAISQIRLWKLGDLEHKVIPTRAALNKLRNILHQTNTGPLDLVWGPELDFKESNTQVHNFLGPEKYQQVMSEIYSGLGVPPSLTGSGGASGGNQGFTNNFISMKVLVERLEIGRKILVNFWNNQFRIIQEAMGFRFPAKLIFDNKVISDETAEKKLLIDLWDRNIISSESILEICKRDPEMEVLRLNRERSKMESGQMVYKTSPFEQSDINRKQDLKKIILQSGGVAPSQVGLELDEIKDGDKIMNEMPGVKDKEEKPFNKGGRPKNSSDKSPRKRKEIKPARKLSTGGDFVNLFIWANDAQSKLSKIVSEPVLKFNNKKNLRQLNKAEQEEYEYIKYKVFSNLTPYSDINKEIVYNLLEQEVNKDILAISKTLAGVFKVKNDREPNVEEMRQIQSSAFAFQYMEEEDE